MVGRPTSICFVLLLYDEPFFVIMEYVVVILLGFVV